MPVMLHLLRRPDQGPWPQMLWPGDTARAALWPGRAHRHFQDGISGRFGTLRRQRGQRRGRWRL